MYLEELHSLAGPVLSRGLMHEVIKVSVVRCPFREQGDWQILMQQCAESWYAFLLYLAADL